MTVYENLLKEDWVQYFEKELDAGQLRFTSDGKILAFTRLTHSMPWIFTKESFESELHNKCSRYQVFFAERLGFLHSRCHICYKVVARPQSVVDLFKLVEVQKEMCVRAKCGIELRSFVTNKYPKANLYGGYFYTDSLIEGQMRYERVKEAVKSIDKNMPVILKRGCSEFEMKYGPSDKWRILPKQHEWEKKFEEIFVVDDGGKKDFQPDYLISYIKRKWIHYAAENGDITYKELTGGRSLTDECNYVTYHDVNPLIKVVGR